MGGFLEIPIASALFLLLFAGSLVRYLRDPNAVAGVVVLIFGAVSPLFAARLLDFLFGLALPQPLQALSLVGVLAQPVLVLWLASLLERVPRWVLPLAVAALAVTAPAVLAFAPAPPLPVALAAVAVYVLTALTAAAYFLRAAGRRIGSARTRLAIAAFATVLMAGTLMILAVAVALPEASVVTRSAARYGVLLAAVGFALAFLTPGWLRRLWSSRTAYDISRRLLTSSAQSDAAATWRGYLDLVTAAAGVRHAALVVGAPEHGGSLVATRGEVREHPRDWSVEAFERLRAQAERAHGRTLAELDSETTSLFPADSRCSTIVTFSVPQGGTAVLVLASDTRSLFSQDDVQIFETLGLEAGLLADRAASSAEQIALADRLSATVEALRAAHQAKSDFLASMSHELRTPLNAILGFSDLMRSEPQADGRRMVPEQWIEHVHVAGRHLLGLINDVLDLAKVEAGRLDLRPEPVDVQAAVTESIAGLRPLIEQKQLSVETRVELAQVLADRGRLRQVLYNLLSNAIKYTPQGGAIAVEAGTSDGLARITVSDTGMGIAPEDHERVFEEFTQVGDAAARQEGTGLGLALSRRLVEAHGGRLELESEPGAGSRFTAVLPLAASVETGLKPSLVPQPSQRDGAQPAIRPATDAPLVLVIEDDPQAVVLLRSYMEPSGYRVTAADDGQAGIAAARREQPAAILLDVLLPGADGWEVLRQLKADPALQDIPVLMITVVDEREVGLALGAVDYLVKPIERTALLTALERHVPMAGNGRRPRVLAVDDDPAALSVVQAALRDQDWEVLLAGSGRQALAAAGEAPLDLVICDLVMPDLDGFEVIARLKADPRTTSIPIVVLTGHELTPGDKARLNGKIVGICEKGDDVAGRLRDWLATVAPAATPIVR